MARRKTRFIGDRLSARSGAARASFAMAEVSG